MRLSRRTLLGSVFCAGLTRIARAAARELDTGFKSVICAAWSWDGKRIACASSDAEIGIWEWPVFRRVATLRGHSQVVRCLSWNVDGNRLVSAGSDSEALVWDTATGLILNRILAPGGFAAWSPDGKRLATTYGNRALGLWDDLGGSPTRVLLHPSQPNSFAWSSDGSKLSSAFGEQLRPPEFIGRVLIWDTATGVASPLFVITGNASLVPGWTSQGTAVLLQSGLKSVDVVDVKTGIATRSLKKTVINGLAVSADGAKAALSQQDGKVRVWNLTDGQIENEIQVDAAGGIGLSWHPGGSWLAVFGSSGKVRFSESRNHEL